MKKIMLISLCFQMFLHLKGQTCFQLNVLPGYLITNKLELSAPKVGVGFELIPGFARKCFMTLQPDFGLSHKVNTSLPLYFFSNSKPSGNSVNFSFRVRQFAYMIAVSRYLKGDPFTKGSAYASVGFKLGKFNFDQFKVDDYDKSLFYYKAMYKPQVGQKPYFFDSEWLFYSSFFIGGGYLITKNHIVTRISGQLAYIYSIDKPEIELNTTKVFATFEFCIGYLFERFRDPLGTPIE